MKLFKLPDLGEGIPDAEVVEWHVAVGDSVKEDQPLVSVETAKAIVEVPCPQTGVIARLCAQEGETVHTGEPLVEFEGEDDSATVVGKIATASSADATADEFYIGASPSTQAFMQAQTVKIHPQVRQLAASLGVELSRLKPLDDRDYISADQVRHAARGAGGTPLFDTTEAEPLKGVRKSMARNMANAHAQIVPVTLFDEADVTHWPKKMDTTTRMIKAIAFACRWEPSLNVWFDGATLSRVVHEAVHVGIAVDTEDGLFVPVIRDANNRSEAQLREGLDAMRKDVQNRSIPPSELKGATISLSNFGMMSGRFATPIVVPPTVAIIGVGRMRDGVTMVKGKAKATRLLPLSLSFDHRAATGGEAARFLKALVSQL